VGLTIQLSNIPTEVVNLLKSVIAPGQRPVVRTEPLALVRHTLLNEQQIEELITAYHEGVSVVELRTRFGIGKSSLYRHLKRAGVKPNRR